jgi:hypothetical protein
MTNLSSSRPLRRLLHGLWPALIGRLLVRPLQAGLAAGALALLALTPAAAQTYTISTLAGTGTQGFSGDGGPATSAQISRPRGVAVDGGGNVYFAEFESQRIRKVNGTTGIISTLAGTGTAGFSGDGGLATSAKLNNPLGVAVDGSGNVYISERSNNRIRKVSGTTGVITTLAGTGVAGFSGDGGPATAAQLNGPHSLAVDGSGNVYFSEIENNRIRKVSGTTGVITTLAGTGVAGSSSDGGPATAAQINSPTGVAVDGNGNVYFAEFENERIRKVSGTTGVISTVAGTGTAGFSGDGGLATSAQLYRPTGVAVDGSGNIYFSDRDNERIRKVSSTTGIISTLAGTGTAGFGGDGGPATSARFISPFGVAVAGNGTIYIGDLDNHRVRQLIAVANLAPTALALSNSSVAENAGANAQVGTLSTTDANAGDTFTYTLVSGPGSTDNGSFNISGNTLRLTASANFETQNSYAIRVRTTDQGGLTFEQPFTITITDVNEAPILTAISPASGPVGVSITLTGTNLINITAVRFNGTAATVFSTGTGTTATATVPVGATTGNVTITTPNGTSNGVAFTVLTAPIVMTATPTTLTTTSAVLGASITGNGGMSSGTTTYGFVYVLGTGTPTLTNYTGTNGTNISPAAVPQSFSAVASNLTPGATYTVRAYGVNNVGTSYGEALTFTTVSALPTLTAISPASGPVGVSITLTGTNLINITAVRFNGTVATVFSTGTGTTATATVPAGATTGNVTITTPNGTSNGVAFTVTANGLASTPALTAAQVALYPNPAGKATAVRVTLPVAAGTRTAHATVLNALGQVMSQTTLTVQAGQASGILRTAGLAAGVYVVRLQAGDAVVSKRLVVE